MFEDALQQAVHFAEYTYDKVIRRWGNVQFARSTIYDYVWSEDFLVLCNHLDDRERGEIRLHVMELFRVKPWPWSLSSKDHYER